MTNVHAISLQATWIRNSVLNALRNTTKLSTRGVSPNFVYQNPTVSALGKFIHNLTSTGASRQLDNAVKDMINLVEKYTQEFHTHKPVGGAAYHGDVVLITGSTGAIGSNTLAELYKTSNVTRIIVLARKSTTPICVRQKKALEDRGLDPNITNSSKINLLEGDPGLPGFGLEDDVLLELKSIVTHILHIGMWAGGTAFSSSRESDPLPQAGGWISIWVFRRSNRTSQVFETSSTLRSGPASRLLLTSSSSAPLPLSHVSWIQPSLDAF